MREMKSVVALTGLVLFALHVPGQAPAKLEFEAASVRVSSPPTVPENGDPVALLNERPRMSGGPGTADPENFIVKRWELRRLLMRAYGIRPDQIAGPSWLESEQFDIRAKVAPGTTRDQLNVMLQNLLVDRFRIQFHHATKKDTQQYTLTVAKTGSKLKETSRLAVTAPGNNAPEPKPGGSFHVDVDRNGFPVLPVGRTGILAVRRDGVYRMTCSACSIAELINNMSGDLAVPVGTPGSGGVLGRVADETGLRGVYNFHLEYAGGGVVGGAFPHLSVDGQEPSGPDLFNALEKQLGLKLEKAKLPPPLDVLVIDHIDRTPADN